MEHDSNSPADNQRFNRPQRTEIRPQFCRRTGQDCRARFNELLVRLREREHELPKSNPEPEYKEIAISARAQGRYRQRIARKAQGREENDDRHRGADSR